MLLLCCLAFLTMTLSNFAKGTSNGDVEALMQSLEALDDALKATELRWRGAVLCNLEDPSISTLI